MCDRGKTKNLSMRNLHIEDISMWLSLNLLKAKLLKASRLFSHTGFDFGSTVVCHLVSLFVHLSVYNKMCQNKFRLFAVVFSKFLEDHFENVPWTVDL